MMFRSAALLVLAALAATPDLRAGERAPLILPLYPEATGSASTEQVKERSKTPGVRDRVVEKVTMPELTITWPQGPQANAPAAVICPGGGYKNLVIDKEGYAIAKWLNEQGFVAAILKYRLPVAGAEQPEIPLPVQDGQQAIRLLRKNAEDWGIDPHRIGVIGSSAGGHLASTLATHFTSLPAPAGASLGSVSARPDFQMLLYPVISFEDPALTHANSRQNLLGENPAAQAVRFYSNEHQVTGETPPAFLVHAEDDKVVPIGNSRRYEEALKAAKVPVKLVVFSSGGHGFGLGVWGGEPATWPPVGEAWLRSLPASR